MNAPIIKIHPLPDSSENNSENEEKPTEKEVGQLSLDIYRTDKEIVIVAPVAGVNKDELDLAITNDVLVIKGERKQKETMPEEACYTKECFWGKFSRAVVLPLEADIKNVSASFDNHVLEIRIPVAEKERTKIIKIKA